MKWFSLCVLSLTLTACGFDKATIVEPQEVIVVTPPHENKAFINDGTSVDVTHNARYYR